MLNRTWLTLDVEAIDTSSVYRIDRFKSYSRYILLQREKEKRIRNKLYDKQRPGIFRSARQSLRLVAQRSNQANKKCALFIFACRRSSQLKTDFSRFRNPAGE